MDLLAVIAAGAALLICLIQNVRLQQRADKKAPDSQAEERMKKIVALYDNIENLMDNFEMYMEEMRQELDRERTHLTELSRQATAMFLQQNEGLAPPPPPVAAPPAVVEPTPEPVKKPEKPKSRYVSRLTDKDRQQLNGLENKTQKVRFLMSCGFSLEEVAKELNIGKGEVRLIADLDRS